MDGGVPRIIRGGKKFRQSFLAGIQQFSFDYGVKSKLKQLQWSIRINANK